MHKLLLLIITAATYTLAFNIDTSSPSLLRTPSATTDFGYSIAISEKSKQIYVGTPNTYNGSFFKCRTDIHPYNIHCEQIDEPMIQSPSSQYRDEKYIPSKIGASLSIFKDVITIGAPGTLHQWSYKVFNTLTNKRTTRKTQRNSGMVFTYTEDQTNGDIKQRESIQACPKESLSAKCKQQADGCGRSNCAAGVQTVILEDKSIVVASPGAFFSQGTVDRFRREPDGYAKAGDGFQYELTNVTLSGRKKYNDILFKDPDLPASFRNTMSRPNFESNTQKSDLYKNIYDSNLVGLELIIHEGKQIVAGAPARYQYGQMGAVVFRRLGNHADDVDQIKGKVLGERFGLSIVSHDFDGDGNEELLVGAPFYTNETCNDCGKVYFYKKNKNGKWKLKQEIVSDIESGRFGYSMAYIGNIDTLPGDEVAVGMHSGLNLILV